MLLLTSGMAVFRLLSYALTGGYEDNYAEIGNATMPGQITVIVYHSSCGWKVLGPSPKELVTESIPATDMQGEPVLRNGGKSSEIVSVIWAKFEI